MDRADRIRAHGLRYLHELIHETADWPVLPCELSGRSIDELREHKPEIAPVIDRLEGLVDARKGTATGSGAQPDQVTFCR